jgi:hypothetical protein
MSRPHEPHSFQRPESGNEVVVQDVFAAVVPEQLIKAPTLVVQMELTKIAQGYVLRQYREWLLGRPRIAFGPFEWLITTNPDEVETFQPAHDCAACRAGNDQAMAYLRENPDRPIALVNMTYTELWP